MHPSRLSLMATLFAAAGKSIAAPLREFEEFQRPTPSFAHINRYQPHQGKRECARRRGGSSWIAYRNADRQRRGLPVLSTFQPFGDTSNDGGYVQ